MLKIWVCFFSVIQSKSTSDSSMFVVRSDRIGGAFGTQFSQSISAISSEKRLINNNEVSMAIKSLPPKAPLDPSLSFQFNFECLGTNQQLCDCAKSGFSSAGSRIAQVLQINSPIIINAKFHSFCLAQGGGSCIQANNTIGRASVAAYFSAEDINSIPGQSSGIYYYPQSLVKQLTNDPLSFAPVDIYAEFNSDFNFYFKSSGLPISVNQTDFEFVVAHELTHGLGFDSAWVQYSNYYSSSFTTPSDILSPLPSALGPTYASAIISAISPLNIFDSLVQVTNTSNPMTAFAMVISNFSVKGLSITEFVNHLTSDPDLNTAAKNAMSAAKSGLQVKLPESPLLLDLHTPVNYAQGTSIVHLSSKASKTKDFLMIPAISPFLGKGLDDILISVNSSSIYGSGITAIMAGMGWPTIDNPTIRPIHVIRTSKGFGAVLHHRVIIISLFSLYLNV